MNSVSKKALSFTLVTLVSVALVMGSDISEPIRDLGKHDRIYLRLGKFIVLPSEGTNLVINSGKEAEPTLIKHLKSESEPRRLAMIVYCLRRIKSESGLMLAETLRRELREMESKSLDELLLESEIAEYRKALLDE